MKELRIYFKYITKRDDRNKQRNKQEKVMLQILMLVKHHFSFLFLCVSIMFSLYNVFNVDLYIALNIYIVNFVSSISKVFMIQVS